MSLMVFPLAYLFADFAGQMSLLRWQGLKYDKLTVNSQMLANQHLAPLYLRERSNYHFKCMEIPDEVHHFNAKAKTC